LLAADVFTHQWGWQSGSNEIRLLTGLIAGFAIGLFIVSTLPAATDNQNTFKVIGIRDIVIGLLLVLLLWGLIPNLPAESLLVVVLFEMLSVFMVYAFVWGVLITYGYYFIGKKTLRPAIWLGLGGALSILQIVVLNAMKPTYQIIYT
jgi:hypothetical protein